MVAYLPGLDGPFLFDDEPNLRPIAQHPSDWKTSDVTLALAGNDSGPLRRPVSVASFYLQAWALNGLTPFAAKAINLALHLLNGCLVLVAMRQALGRRATTQGGEVRFPRSIAPVAAALWIVNPMHVSTVLYSVQRMTILSATFSLVFIVLALIGLDDSAPRRTRLLSASASLPVLGLAALSKENGLLAPLLLMVASQLVPRTTEPGPMATRPVVWVGALLLMLAATLATVTDLPGLLQVSYAGRPWSPCERLLTEGSILLRYAAGFVLPSPHFQAFFWDDVPVLSCSIASSMSWLAILAALAWLAGLPRARLAAMGLAWFLVGHLMESTVLPLELAFEHRNYLPSVGLALMVASALSCLETDAGARGTFMLAVALVFIFGAALGLRSHRWSSEQMLAEHHLAHHPKSALAHALAGRLAADEWLRTDDRRFLAKAQSAFERASQLNPRTIAPIGSLILLSARDGVPIPDGLLKDMASRLASGTIHRSTPAQLHSFATEVISLRPDAASTEILPLYSAALGNPTIPERTEHLLLLSLAEIYAVSRDFPAAEEILTDLVVRNPSESEIRLAIVRTALRTNNPERLESAVKEYEDWASSTSSPLRFQYLMRRLELDLAHAKRSREHP